LTLLAPLAPAQAVDGALDPTFGTAGQTRVFFDQGTTDEDRGYDVAVDALGRIVVVGIVDVAGVKRWGVTRLLPNGALDTSFSVGGVPGDGKLVLDAYVADPAHPPVVAVWDRLDDDPDSRNDIVVAGRAGGNAAYCAVNAEGSGFACAQDATFISYWYVDVELRGSSVYLGGTIAGSGTDRNFFIERHSTTAFPWPLDASFGQGGVRILNYDVPGGTGRDELNAIEVTADGEVILAGSRSSAAGHQELFWMKLSPTATATVYEGFKDIVSAADKLVSGLAVAADESFYVSGSLVLTGIPRGLLNYVLPDGTSPVALFDLAIIGGFSDVALQSGGKPLVIAPGSGVAPGFRLFRYLPALVDLDASFSGGEVQYPFTDGPGADVSEGRALALQGGRIIAVGEAEWNAPDFDFGVIRLESSSVFADGFEVGSASAWSTVAP
jgi:uncharacterized delta-60 repeat protein